MHIIGTAGHVDHGKSSLVRALTGTDPDRWIEEQRRGMTLDLGFAHLTFADGTEAGIIDVPGHERFLHNMLAGAAGMELILLVIAANEGPKPQTLEHLAILHYLNARSALVVLTKSDTVTGDELERVTAQLRGQLAGTLAAGAPIYPVSSRTGDGLPALREAIRSALGALPARAPNAPPYLPIDRVFALAGHGTVVTGTLMQGRIAVGDSLALSPLGRSVRVRSLQVFGAKRDAVTGGTRVAVNLPGIELTEIARGAVLAGPQFRAAQDLRVRFTPLPAAVELLKRRMPVRVYIGAAEVLGTLVFERIPVDAQAVPARLHLRVPTIVIPNAPFVVRRVSPMNLLGGGTISAGATSATQTDSDDDRERDSALCAIAATGPLGALPAQIGAATNLAPERVQTLLTELVSDGRIRRLMKPPAFIAGDIADELLAQTLERLRQRQHERPWLMGTTSLALAQMLKVAEPTLIRVLAMFVEAGALAYRGGYYATTDFSPRLSAEQRAFFDRAFAPPTGVPPAPLLFEELRARIKASPIGELSQAFDTLVASGAVSKVGDFLYRGSEIAAFRAQLESVLRRQGQVTVAEFRTLTGTSRKYAVPLLEFFDATGVTLRTGDQRILRQTAAPKTPESFTS